jgi:MFS family permease
MTPMPSGTPPETLATSRFKILAAMRYREYRLFWLGGAFSNIGMWALIYGRLWLMHDLTDAPLMLGVVTMSSLGPVLLLSVWGGVIADKVNRLRLVTVSRAIFSLLALLTATLIAIDIIRPWHLIAISLSTGVLLAFDIPSRQAMLPNLVPREHLVNAIAVYSFVTAGSAIIGPGIFAPLVSFWGLEGLFFLIGIAYSLTVVMLLLMKPVPRQTASDGSTLWQGLLEGLAYVRGHRMILSVLVIGVIGGIFGMSFETLLPVFADQVLSGDVYVYSWLLLAAGVGGLAGTVTLAWVGNSRNAITIQLIAGLGLGLGLAAFSQIDWLPLAMGVIALVGSSGVTFVTINNTIVQNWVVEEFRGRVMSLHQLTWGVTAIGGLLMGSLAQLMDAPFALLVGGLVTASGTVMISTLVLRKWRPRQDANL